MLEFRTCLLTPGVGFLFNPPPRNSVTAVECGGDGGSASAIGLPDDQVESLYPGFIPHDTFSSPQHAHLDEETARIAAVAYEDGYL